MSNKKGKPVDRAVPTIRKPRGTDTTKVGVTRSTTTAMKGSALWQGAPALQAAVTTWNAVADAMDANAKAIHDLRAQLAVLVAAQQGHRRDWGVAMKQVFSQAEVTSNGSPDQVRALGLDVLTRASLGPLAAPSGVSAASGKAAGEVILTWLRGDTRHGFLVQHATDVANLATYSSPIASTKTKYTLKGAQSSSVVHLRVAAIDPTSDTGQSPWSDWAAGTAK